MVFVEAMQVFAGVILLCVHGVNIWANVQFVMDVQYTEFGVMMTSYHSTSKDKQMVWPALKRGFGIVFGQTPFMSLAAELTCPTMISWSFGRLWISKASHVGCSVIYNLL